MDYHTILDMVVELGYCLAMSGAETFRIEESVNHITKAYGVQAEAFAIPNCLHVSIQAADGKPITRMRRIGFHGNNMDAVEKYSNLSRKICRERPEPETALQWIREVTVSLRRYPLSLFLIGHFLGALGFALIFGGNLADCLCAGACGVIVGVGNKVMDRFKANQFFRLIAVSFIMALAAYLAARLGLTPNADATIIGTLMILVPGLLFTNAMRDIIYGDTNSGINRIVQVFLIAVAIAVGTAVAWKLVDGFWGIPESSVGVSHGLLAESIACFIGCMGFVIQFNIHGRGKYLCALGGVLSWVTYRLVLQYNGNDIVGYFFATFVAAFYSEIIARIRKYPAISYLVISIFPLIPGAGAYYTMNYAVRGEMTLFAERGMHTISIAGVMAVGILLASSAIRIVSDRLHQRHSK